METKPSCLKVLLYWKKNQTVCKRNVAKKIKEKVLLIIKIEKSQSVKFSLNPFLIKFAKNYNYYINNLKSFFLNSTSTSSLAPEVDVAT